jgi:hypothetical protein
MPGRRKKIGFVGRDGGQGNGNHNCYLLHFSGGKSGLFSQIGPNCFLVLNEINKTYSEVLPVSYRLKNRRERYCAELFRQPSIRCQRAFLA